ncbi:zinc finger domain-containing protein, partial [Klebsiella pneumoniae]|uniref:zinc finger domain-containing protein n=1 Tax=Klebsiella pneumoniae TaxID=573 RepID=UPI003EB9794E
DAMGTAQGLKVALSKAEGEKCPRCWHYTTDIGKVAEHAEICERFSHPSPAGAGRRPRAPAGRSGCGRRAPG